MKWSPLRPRGFQYGLMMLALRHSTAQRATLSLMSSSFTDYMEIRGRPGDTMEPTKSGNLFQKMLMSRKVWGYSGRSGRSGRKNESRDRFIGQRTSYQTTETTFES